MEGEMEIKFAKMEGIGNDYVYINIFNTSDIQSKQITQLLNEKSSNWSKIVQFLSDRRYGVGGDGVILIAQPSGNIEVNEEENIEKNEKFGELKEIARMIMFNADGNRGKICGNGLRCVGKYVYDFIIPSLIQNNEKILQISNEKTSFKVETDAGLRLVSVFHNIDIEKSEKIARKSKVEIEMSKAKINEKLNVKLRNVFDNSNLSKGAKGLSLERLHFFQSKMENKKFDEEEEKRVNFSFVDLGNPHAVVYFDSLPSLWISSWFPSSSNNYLINNNEENKNNNSYNNNNIDNSNNKCENNDNKINNDHDKLEEEKEENKINKERFENFDLEKYGPILQFDDHLEEEVNVEYVWIKKLNNEKKEVWVRVYERGSGETLACGSGACAVVAAGVSKNIFNANENISVYFRGGKLDILCSEKFDIQMTGDAVFVFSGAIFLPSYLLS